MNYLERLQSYVKDVRILIAEEDKVLIQGNTVIYYTWEECLSDEENFKFIAKRIKSVKALNNGFIECLQCFIRDKVLIISANKDSIIIKYKERYFQVCDNWNLDFSDEGNLREIAKKLKETCEMLEETD